MRGILAADWVEQVDAERSQRSAALLHAALGSDGPVVDRALDHCNAIDQVRLYAGLLADACKRAGWGVETRPMFGRLDEGE